MKWSVLLHRYLLLSMLLLSLSSCGGGGSDTSSVTPSVASNDQAVVADQTYTVRAVAGFESGLVKLASIDGRIAAGKRDNVIIDYAPGAKLRSAQGMLYNCSGAGKRNDCDVYGTVLFNHPGTYNYTVTYESAGLFGGTVQLTGKIVVEPPGDFVIVSVGDSVASGEGSPQLPLENLKGDGGYWNDILSDYLLPGEGGGGIIEGIKRSFEGGCHRSSWAGPVRAANRIANTNNVTFIHIACSGASLGDIQAGDKYQMDEDEKIIEPRVIKPEYAYASLGKIDTQLNWIREHYDRIDVLVVSAGANNVNDGFGSVVTACLGPGTCSEDDTFVNGMRSSMLELPGLYDRFAEQIQTGCGSASAIKHQDCPSTDNHPVIPPDQVPSVVVITEYFDPTRNEDGVFPSDGESFLCTGKSINNLEWEFLYNEMVVPLNNAVQMAADRNGWNYVGGIADAFRTHGYCSSPGLGDGIGDAWVVKLPESEVSQGDHLGTAHPDRTGQGVYGDRIYAEIVRANPPRTRASATTNGQPYEFGTWVNTDVEVTLQAYNPIKESGVSGTYYADSDPLCTHESALVGACQDYTMPFTVSQSGRNVVSFYSTNLNGAPETHAKPVEVLIDKEPPVMTCDALPDELWPPNKSMVGITVNVTAVDEVSGPADYILVDIQDSAGDAGNAVQDFDTGTADTHGMMLVDRKGYGGDRYYTLTYQSVDAVGNIGTCDAVVTVPHDQGKNN
ncbi:MAG: hypothetical protein P8Y24_02305 [Gammaproteobacteria bacterium]